MLNTLLGKITNKILYAVILVLATLLTTFYVVNSNLEASLTNTRDRERELTQVNDRLNKTISSLSHELETKPVEYITITKEVVQEVCEGKVKYNAIMNLPAQKEAVSEKVDIDAKLPADLLRLLQ